jgi:benzoyl-CoA reductase/2-hydroxyglutaryl-CoA dehydratase subunit BcrC/BadD/HgdB
MKKIIRLTESDLTRIVKRVIKENEKKDTLINMIKEDGWMSVSEIVGGSDNLKRLSEIDTPMKYLNLFNDLNSMTDEIRPSWEMFFYNENNPIMMLISNTGEGNKTYIGIEFMRTFVNTFDLTREDSIEYIKNWLSNTYGYEVDNSNIIIRRGYPFNQFRSEGMINI